MRVRGRVQGVGFRPWVWRLANELGLKGDVKNLAGEVEIRLQGSPEQLHAFRLRLLPEQPQQAHIQTIQEVSIERFSADGFSIVTSRPISALSDQENEPLAGCSQLDIAPDLAPCGECLADMRDPNNRRFQYPFVNCTQCGPRYSLIRQLPYDRPNTSMGAFDQCPACLSEYQDPSDRRFHAQPNACPECGPSLWLETWSQASQQFVRVDGRQDEYLIQVVQALVAGEILAIRGVGGFHMVCDANQPQAIAELRRRKKRPAKPLAIMVATLEDAAYWVQLNDQAEARLNSPEAPIVLSPRAHQANQGSPDTLELLAPGLNALGVMLPHSPLQWLLFDTASRLLRGKPLSTWHDPESGSQPFTLVMTSGNPSGEPLIADNQKARDGLAGVADWLLLHNRDIVQTVDDSVVSCLTPDSSKTPQRIRIGRGAAPLRLALPSVFSRAADIELGVEQKRQPSVLALGSFLKNTLALNSEQQIAVSQHIGDLDHPDNCRRLQQTLEQLQGLMKVRPDAIACDLHPEGFGRITAEALAQKWGVPLLPVPHHFAHLAAALFEPQAHWPTPESPVLGLALDGYGMGWDGAARGGELILILPHQSDESPVSHGKQGGLDWQPIGALAPLSQPGADVAAKQPWRMALSALLASESEALIAPWSAQAGLDSRALTTALKQIQSGINSPVTTSAGRWFDAVAGLLGLCNQQTYEGEAAMRLQAQAERHLEGPEHSMPNKALLQSQDPSHGHNHEAQQATLELAPLFRHLANRYIEALADGQSSGAPMESIRAQLAYEWHQSLAQALALWVSSQSARLSAGQPRLQVRQLILTGGCGQNSLLQRLLQEELRPTGIQLLVPAQLPMNDAGISAGQLLWAQSELVKNEHSLRSSGSDAGPEC